MTANGHGSNGHGANGSSASGPPRTVVREGSSAIGVDGTRPKLAMWDRTKLLLLIAAVWLALVSAAMANNPIEPFSAAAYNELNSGWWLVTLFVLEAIHQIHNLICERSASWNLFFTDGVFGGFHRWSLRYSDWTRFRIGRVLRIVIGLVVLAIILGAFFHTSPFLSLFQVPAAIYQALPFVLQLAFAFFFIAFQFIGMFWLLSRGGTDLYFPGDIKTRFSDVWGQDAVLDRIKENIIFLTNPEAIEEKGGYVPGGMLLWGPPGTGKTLMAEAVAGETSNPFVFVDPGAFINMFFGIGVLKVKSLFRKLRKLALRYGGVVVFFDEADSLGSRGGMLPGMTMSPSANPMASQFSDQFPCNGLSYIDPTQALDVLTHAGQSPSTGPVSPPRWRDRIMGVPTGLNGGGMGGGGMGTLQALLTELSGLKKPRGITNRVFRRILGMRPKPPPKYRILVMMATNMPNALDPALLRPGRIDRIYKVGYPSKVGRVKTYEGYLAKVNHELTPEQIDRLATITPYATGATIKDLVNEALIIAIRDGRDTITWRDVISAKHLKALGPPEDVDYIERERHAVALHEACHAVVAAKVRHHLVIDIATIEKGSSYLGMVSSVKPEDRFTQWKSEYEADIMVAIASLVGEKMFFDGDSSAGVSGDLETATYLATIMQGYLGMGSTVASHGVTQQVGIGSGLPGRTSRTTEKELLNSSLGQRIEDTLARLFRRTESLLIENRQAVMAVAHALEVHKTLSGEDAMAIIEGKQGPIIDGRPYHTEEFRVQAEAYHAAVVKAHKLHQKVDVPLPVVGESPELALVAFGGPAAPEALEAQPGGAEATDPGGPSFGW